MQKTISILRGINVGGQKKILMADLKTLYQQLGFRDVATYIQSGNVVFETEFAEEETQKKAAGEKLAKKIELAIFEKYNFQVPVLILTKKELNEAIQNNPFLTEKGILLDKLHITFLAEIPEPALVDKIKDLDFQQDRFIISGKNVYIYCPESYGNSKLTNNFFENKLKVKATTRNWKTLNELAAMSVD
ncbi:MAG: hypothetical protein RI894_117 [Bacteroidota bacterium]|jgi:uncharacterized protein (DUF1697 family)